MQTRCTRWERPVALIGCGVLLALAACGADGLTGNGELPPQVPDPSDVQTPAGALSLYAGALVRLRGVVGSYDGTSYVLASGMLTDELRSTLAGQRIDPCSALSIDVRNVPEGTADAPCAVSTPYEGLNDIRAQARQAIGALAKYAPDASPALRGHLFAVEAYAEVMLADMFCSGIPLSTLDFEGDYTLAAGSTTRAVYEHAIAQFDTAIVLAADSDRFVHAARIGRGRALLALGRYAEAAQAVAAVPDGYQYVLQYDGASTQTRNGIADLGTFRATATMVDREGGTGLDFVSSRDPRTAWDSLGLTQYHLPVYRAAKYRAANAPIVLADAIEARLIEVEAALHANSASWLTALNALRTDGTFDTQPNDTNPAMTDTIWHAGTGGVVGLAPLDDPGTQDARVDLVFRERAFWLFLTGHRQGDLRRLVREYGRDARTVYPSGPYSGGGSYGTDVTVAIPVTERIANPKFTGCLSRGA